MAYLTDDVFMRIIEWYEGQVSPVSTEKEVYVEIPVGSPPEPDLLETLGLKNPRKAPAKIRVVRNTKSGEFARVEGYQSHPQKRASRVRVHLLFSYEVGCVPNKERDVALACGHRAPRNVFEEKLDSWIQDYARRHDDFFDQPSEEFTNMAVAVAEIAREEGWDLNLVDDSPFLSALDAEVEEYTNLPVSFRGSTDKDEVSIRVRVGTLFNTSKAISDRPSDLHTQIKKRIAIIVSEHVTRPESRDPGLCGSVLKSHLNEWMKSFGMQIEVDAWTVKGAPVQRLSKIETCRFFVEFPPPGCLIQARVELMDAKKFENIRTPESPNVESWIKHEVADWMSFKPAPTPVSDREKEFKIYFSKRFAEAGYELLEVQVIPRVTANKRKLIEEQAAMLRREIATVQSELRQQEESLVALEKVRGRVEEIEKIKGARSVLMKKSSQLTEALDELDSTLSIVGPKQLPPAEPLRGLPAPESDKDNE